MSYGESVLNHAIGRLEQSRQRRLEQQEKLKKELYDAVPEVEVLDRRLRQTMPKVLAVALSKGEDPQEAVSRLRAENKELQMRREELIVQAGYLPHELEASPRCPICQDSGWRGAVMCRCLRTFCAEEQIRELSALLNLGEQSFDQFRLDFYDEELWSEYARSPRSNMAKVLAFCKAYASDFGKFPVKNLFFYGGTGLGKTFLSACIARVVSEGGYSVVYDTAGTIFTQFEEQKFSRNEQDVRAAKDLTRKYLKCDLLIVDDLGSELTTPFVHSTLYQLINTRLLDEKSTVISSNLNPEQIRRRYSPQVSSRMEGEYESLLFFGKDIRIKKRNL